ncbi:MAG: nitrous oxide reductase family maturation protein NosD [Bacteroidetes bacterium]|jgi:nitrous oxidase accessory protein|nr:nitrous oxide reductase family maturation protein NosD [Bacteroidota bacterium]
MNTEEIFLIGKKLWQHILNGVTKILPFFIFIVVVFPLQAAVVNVSKQDKISSIKQAIAIALPGDTVIIHGGVYKEKNIVINKKLTLLGKNNPVLDGENKYEILTIKDVAGAVVSGITFQFSGFSSLKDLAAIKVIDSRQILISNNTILNTHFAIFIASSDNFRIEGNQIRGTPGDDEQSTGNGIHLWKNSYATIVNNRITGHRDGIYFEFVQHSTISNNYCKNNIRYGLHFMFSNNDEYIKNTFEENGAGVAVMFSHHIHMYSNHFMNNQGASTYGLLLKEINDGIIKDNVFEQNTIGIYLEGTNRIDVINNQFIRNGYALRIQASCNNNNVHSNNFFENTFDVATNGSLVLNNFNGNYWDKYDGYDLKHDGVGDVPYRPISLFSMVIENIPVASIFLRSFVVFLLDQSEKIIPSITPENLVDNTPLMKPVKM